MNGTLKQCQPLNIVITAPLHITLAIHTSRSPLELFFNVVFINM